MGEEYLYKVGDVVRIREELDSNGIYRMKSGPMDGYNPGISLSMTKRGGEIRTILGYTGYGCYYIDDGPNGKDPRGDWNWTDEMLEPVGNECCCESLL